MNSERLSNLTHSLPAKTLAFLFVILASLIALGSIVAFIGMGENNFYTADEAKLQEEFFGNKAFQDAHILLRNYLDRGENAAEAFTRNTNFMFEISKENGTPLARYYDGSETPYTYPMKINAAWPSESTNPDEDVYVVTIYIAKSLEHSDAYKRIATITHTAYALRYWVIPIAILSICVAVGGFVFLMAAAGRRKGSETIHSGLLVKIPLEIVLAGIGGAAVCVLALALQMTDAGTYSFETAVLFVALGIAAGLTLLIWLCMHFAVRVKLGSWWHRTLIFQAAMHILRFFRWLGGGIKLILTSLPLIWKVALGLFLLAIVHLWEIAIGYNDPSFMMSFWLMRYLIFGPLILYAAIMLRRLEKGAASLASGDLSHQVPTKGMVGNFKRSAIHLNSIGGGMARAVDQRLKSERMKTELITNVSHDIKTPLTSIINYADLISKEESSNPKIAEYTETLLKHSDRLKHLIEDLVEASKASSGAVDVQKAPCDMGVLFEQILGEYAQKLEAQSLEIVTRLPDASVMIMADGHLLRRVFDNLLNNIYKYAQPHTRVYLSAQRTAQAVTVTLKNISSAPLGISTDELLERFVRGDAARHSEGNGLGLSIAKSLTELQGGTLAIDIDGDLFKVTLTFEPCV